MKWCLRCSHLVTSHELLVVIIYGDIPKVEVGMTSSSTIFMQYFMKIRQLVQMLLQRTHTQT
jgi:hypothetical protein